MESITNKFAIAEHLQGYFITYVFYRLDFLGLIFLMRTFSD